MAVSAQQTTARRHGDTRGNGARRRHLVDPTGHWPPLISALLFLVAFVQAQQAQGPPPNPFAPPQARVHYAPDRDYDLLHIALDLKVDYARLAFQGVVVNTLAPLRDGLTQIAFHCGENLNVEACETDGQKAVFSRDGETLKITGAARLVRGKSVRVIVHYASAKEHEGFHWIRPIKENPRRVGFYTERATVGHRYWVPTWDYPNDFATTETRVTVPADWYVVGNGALRSNILNPRDNTRTFHWQMEQPHATYLLSLAAGPFDIKTSTWQGVTLMYIVPEGKVSMIDETFGETPEMLSFFSELTGVKYPWSKYAQTAMYDYGGGMEWVSATTIGESALTDKRRGFRMSAGIVSHELAHQWFGDLVTCRDWGHLWLNEGFASFFSQLYGEHARGRNFYENGIEDGMRGYFSESRRYKRPLATNLYASTGVIFDAHTYAKGGLILHTLRRNLGDEAFFRGIKHYLDRFRNSPVDSHDFCDAMTEATGINLEPFFEQWVYKPGHPVLNYVWTWDEAKEQVVLSVKQTQDTKDGTPIYDLTATVGLLSSGKVTRQKVRINNAEQEIRIDTGKPDAVLVDPDHDFLREIPNLHWAAEELVTILKYAPNAADREKAMNKMLEGTPSEAAVQAVADSVRADKGQFPVFRSIGRLGELKRSDLRALFREQIAHPDFDRREQAVIALGLLPKDDGDIKRLRDLVNDQQPYAIVRASVLTLSNWDAPGNRDIFRKAAEMPIINERIRLMTRLAAYDALAKADAAEGKGQPEADLKTTQLLKDFLSDVANGVKDSPRMTPVVRDFAIPRHSGGIAGWLKDLKSFSFLTRDDLQERAMERRGAKVSRICYYKMLTGSMTLYIGFYLTADGKVTDIDVLPQ